MKVDVILGLQWGDEGKGKVVDVISPGYDIIARFQGGPNAGHTIEFDGGRHILHLLPSGIFHKNTTNIIGNGVVVDPLIIMKEIAGLSPFGISAEQNLIISKRAHLILPSHRLLDACFEAIKGNLKIGSTLKGISPVYTDKAARSGLRAGDIFSERFFQKYGQLKQAHLLTAQSTGHDYRHILIDGLPFGEYEEKWMDAVQQMKKLRFEETEVYINEALRAGKTVLAEGAQGSLLDLEFGSYPFVTSSNTVCGGVCTGLGVSPHSIGTVYGIFKAYCTRVGSGPFPTEQSNELGDELRKLGNEYGSTTGRARRCGWLDLPALNYAVMINGVDELIMTKADVLSTFDEIEICTNYTQEGKEMNYLPFDLGEKSVVPSYKKYKGWESDLGSVTALSELPAATTAYIDVIENYVQKKISMVSTGPGREHIIKTIV
jgi:adenylosuccinate synthase